MEPMSPSPVPIPKHGLNAALIAIIGFMVGIVGAGATTYGLMSLQTNEVRSQLQSQLDDANDARLSLEKSAQETVVYHDCTTEAIAGSASADAKLVCLNAGDAPVTVLESIHQKAGLGADAWAPAHLLFRLPESDTLYFYFETEGDVPVLNQWYYDLKTAESGWIASWIPDLTPDKTVENVDIFLSSDNRYAALAARDRQTFDIDTIYVIDLRARKLLETISAPKGKSFTSLVEFRVIRANINWLGQKLSYGIYPPPPKTVDSDRFPYTPQVETYLEYSVPK